MCSRSLFAFLSVCVFVLGYRVFASQYLRDSGFWRFLLCVCAFRSFYDWVLRFGVCTLLYCVPVMRVCVSGLLPPCFSAVGFYVLEFICVGVLRLRVSAFLIY